MLLRQIPLCLSSGERGSERVEREREMLRGKREIDNLCCPFYWWWQNPLNATSSVSETNTLELVRAGALVSLTFHYVYALCQWSSFCLKSRLFCSCTYSKDCFGTAVNAKRWVACLLWQGPQPGYPWHTYSLKCNKLNVSHSKIKLLNPFLIIVQTQVKIPFG